MSNRIIFNLLMRVVQTHRRDAFGLRILTIASTLWFAHSSPAATINATSTELKDVAAAVARATDGDIVAIPAGTSSWTSTLIISNKSITLKGASYYTYTGMVGVSNSNVGDSVIIDEAPGQYTPIIKVYWPRTDGSFCRITGFHFKGGSTNTSDRYSGAIQVIGTHKVINNSRWRIDHCFADGLRGVGFLFYAWGGGLFDNNYVIRSGGECPLRFNGSAGDYGDSSWATDINYGTVDEGVYIENNYFIFKETLGGITDAYQGARYVFRYNTVTNGYVSGHGTESSNRERGTRWVSVYGTAFQTSIWGSPAVYSRSGTGVIFSNVLSGNWSGLLSLNNYRLMDTFSPWGGAFGANIWDLNRTNIFDSGTHTGDTMARKVVDITKSWTPNQWSGYSVINTTTGQGGLIYSNSPTELLVSDSQYSNPLAFKKSDAYEIRKVDKVLDGNGQGKGDLLTGNSTPAPAGWPHQEDDPWYYWANTGNNLKIYANPAAVSERNYIHGERPNYPPLTYPHPFAHNGSIATIPPPTSLQIHTPQP